MKFAMKRDITHLTIEMLLHYLGKFKSLIFCKYLADMEKCKQIAYFIYQTQGSSGFRGVEWCRLVSIVQ